MKKIKYELVIGKEGFDKFCKDVSERLNSGWKPIGGVAFNAGFAYQSVAKIVEESDEKSAQEQNQKTRNLGANEAMKQLDSMT